MPPVDAVDAVQSDAVVEQATPAQDTSTTDPFQVDPAVLATLSPEQRQTVDPLISSWKKSAQEAIKRETDSASKKYASYSDYEKKAQALDQLVQDQRFVQWYRQMQQGGQPKQTEPQNVLQTIGVSPNEYAEAVQEAAAGAPDKLNNIQLRINQAWAQPIINTLNQKQMELTRQIEVDNLYRRHPDAEELNSIGVERPGDASILELAAAEIIDRRGGNWEQTYQYAKKMADAFRSKSKQEALGLVASKKDSVTEGSSKTIKDSPTTIEVDSPEQALRENLRAAMQGKSNVTYVTRPRTRRK